MKLLCINCKPDLSYFSKRGLTFEVEYKTIPNLKFPAKFLYNQNGKDMYTPDVNAYLEENYKTFQYSGILIGWNPMEYSNAFANTGGYTYFNPLSCGTFWSTVRNDANASKYAVHELHHMLCSIVNRLPEAHVIDYMDQTLINGIMLLYYKNDDPEAIDGNHSMTWNQIKRYLPQLQAIKYNDGLVVTLTRLYDWGKETVGQLVIGDFKCNTLELGFHQNQTNISSIPNGIYKCKWSFSPKFLKYTYEVLGVPNRSGIRIHSSNLYSQLLGCIALGRGYENLNTDGLPDIMNSRVTLDQFNKLINKREFTLIVKNK